MASRKRAEMSAMPEFVEAGLTTDSRGVRAGEMRQTKPICAVFWAQNAGVRKSKANLGHRPGRNLKSQIRGSGRGNAWWEAGA